MKVIGFFVALIIIFSTSQVYADVTINDYKESKNLSAQQESIRAYIGGIGHGFEWASSFLQNRGSKPLYCPPKQLAFNTQNYIDILDSQLVRKQNIYTPEDSIAMVLLFGFQYVFPCEK